MSLDALANILAVTSRLTGEARTFNPVTPESTLGVLGKLRNVRFHRPMTVEQIRVLTILGRSMGGITEPLLVHGHNVATEMLVELINGGLASAKVDHTRAGDRRIEVVTGRITPAGLEAVKAAVSARQS
jgi:hypothetical protein